MTVDPRINFGLRKGDCLVTKLTFSCLFLGWSCFSLTNRTNFDY